MKQIVWTALILIILVLAVGLLFIYSGTYNMAASEPHADLEEWVLETTRDNSVEARAENILPPELNDSALIQRGSVSYDAMCAQCHGAPGVARHEFARGLNPHPPALVEATSEYTPEEIFWIIKHGFKFTGMPSFGVTHSDEQIWALTAFVNALPDITPSEYTRLREPTQSPADTAAEAQPPQHEHGAHEH